jgi:arylsulfatase A-like enzyme/Flp pilus assembly protein TadD
VRINGAAGVSSDVLTLAEVFKERGYRTGAFIAASVLDSAFGLGRGFSVYDDNVHSEKDVAGTDIERPADRVCDAALAWLGQRPEDPFFAWVHFFDPHLPYTPPPRFAERLPDPYDGEIAFVDSQVDRLVKYVDAAGLRANTMLVLVGDHGQGLGDHKETAHGLFIYDSTMRVPLILSLPGVLPEARTVASPVGVVDLFPTIIDLLGWTVPQDLDGRSLARACLMGEAPSSYVYGENEYPRLGFGWAPLYSLTGERWKYIDAPRPELYDLPADPGEMANVFDDRPAVAEQMRGKLSELIMHLTAKRRTAEPVVLDDAALERLASLGYVAGASAPDALDDGVERRDPKDMWAVFAGVTQAVGMVMGHKYEQALALLEPLVRESAECGVLLDTLGTAYLRLGRYREAQRAFEASLEAAPDLPLTLYRLGEAFRYQGRFDEAVRCYQRGLAIAPGWERCHRGLGAAYFQSKQFALAELHCRRCVELHPTSPRYLANLGAVLVELGRAAEAIPLLKQALEYDRGSRTAHGTLWRGFLALGRRAEAIRSLKAALKTLPDVRSFACPLAWLLATTPGAASGDIADAIRWAEECCAADPRNARNFDALAAAHAAGGDYARAAQAARTALGLANAHGRAHLGRQIEARLRLYESGRPFIESTSRGP